MRVVSMGELLIDFVALESGVTVGDASGFQKAPGGAPANVAVAIKRLGLESAFITQVGDDPFGHYLAGVLEADGIDTSGLRFSAEARTMLAFVSLAPNGERSFMFYRHPSADMLLRPQDIATSVIQASDVYHFGSITLITSPAKEATLFGAQTALDAGKFVSYDPNLRMALWESPDHARAGMRLGLGYAHIVKVSDEEVNFVLEAGEQLSDWWAKFPRLQVIALTHGEHGSEVFTRSGKHAQVAGFKVKAVDTTGAGDTFVAGLLVGILEQHAQTKTAITDLDYAPILRFANAGAALATTQRGAIPALPTRAEVETFAQS